MPEANGATRAIDPEQTRLRELLRSRAATRALAEGAMTRLTGGLSNQAWRVEQGGQTWYARLGYENAERLGVNRHSECALLSVVAAARFAPDVLACDPSTGLLVTRYIEGRTWQVTDAGEPRNLARIGSLLARLHTMPPAPGIAAVSYSEQARRLASTIPDGDARAAALRRQAQTALCRHLDQWVGQTALALVEEPGAARLPDFTPVRLTGGVAGTYQLLRFEGHDGRVLTGSPA